MTGCRKVFGLVNRLVEIVNFEIKTDVRLGELAGPWTIGIATQQLQLPCQRWCQGLCLALPHIAPCGGHVTGFLRHQCVIELDAIKSF